GDDGQFVEIVNPWNRSFSLVGWTLRTGQGGSVSLSSTLPAGGRLLITDNFDTPNPSSPPGHGSVVSLFGVTADGTSRQVVTHSALELPDRNSHVALYNPEGRLVDIFAYESGSVDGKVSFQRP